MTRYRDGGATVEPPLVDTLLLFAKLAGPAPPAAAAEPAAEEDAAEEVLPAEPILGLVPPPPGLMKRCLLDESETEPERVPAVFIPVRLGGRCDESWLDELLPV